MSYKVIDKRVYIHDIKLRNDFIDKMMRYRRYSLLNSNIDIRFNNLTWSYDNFEGYYSDELFIRRYKKWSFDRDIWWYKYIRSEI